MTSDAAHDVREDLEPPRRGGGARRPDAALRRPPPAARGLHPRLRRASRASGRAVRRPDACVATADHYVPTAPGAGAIADAEIRAHGGGARPPHRRARHHASSARATPRQGIVHVIGPEQGLTQPGITLVCGDSHTATHGAFGALAFGIGSTEVEHVLATQCLWQQQAARRCASRVTGARPAGVTAKDVILAIIAQDRRRRRRRPRHRVRGPGHPRACPWTSA